MNPGEVGVTGNESALTLALQTVEKKVRNLEKRKVKFCCEMAKCEKQRTNGARQLFFACLLNFWFYDGYCQVMLTQKIQYFSQRKYLNVDLQFLVLLAKRLGFVYDALIERYSAFLIVKLMSVRLIKVFSLYQYICKYGLDIFLVLLELDGFWLCLQNVFS